MDEYWLEMTTPVGKILLFASETALTSVDISGNHTYLHGRSRPNPLLKRAEHQLQEYFLGTRKDFDIAMTPVGTDFQQRVWKTLQKIPYGETCSYGQVAQATGNPSAYRAVGSACRGNPIPIIIPCHRVVGSNGHLTGFGGGLNMKAWLLNHEGSDV